MLFSFSFSSVYFCFAFRFVPFFSCALSILAYGILWRPHTSTTTMSCALAHLMGKIALEKRNTNENTCCVYIGYPVVNDPLYNHEVFGPLKGRGGDIGGKTDEELVRDLINIHNAENWLGIDGDSELSLFKTMKADSDDGLGSLTGKGKEGFAFNCNSKSK